MAKFEVHTETSKNGHKWTEVSSNVWKDETSGLIWYDIINGTFTWQEALDLVKSDELKLPKASDFMVMVEHDGMEFLPNLETNYFWSSSPAPDLSDSAYVFNGDVGYIYYYYSRFDSNSIRCVKR